MTNEQALEMAQNRWGRSGQVKVHGSRKGFAYVVNGWNRDRKGWDAGRGDSYEAAFAEPSLGTPGRDKP